MFEKVETKDLDEFFDKHGFVKVKSHYFVHSYLFKTRRIGFPTLKTNKTYLKHGRVKMCEAGGWEIDIEQIKEDILKIKDKTDTLKSNKNCFEFRKTFIKNDVLSILSNFDLVIDKVGLKDDYAKLISICCYKENTYKKEFYQFRVDGDNYSYKKLNEIDIGELEVSVYKLFNYYDFKFTCKIKNLHNQIKTRYPHLLLVS